MAWSQNDARYIAFGGGDDETFIDAQVDTKVYLWDWQQNQIALTYQGQQRFIDAIAWSPDGTRIASGSDDTTVRVWQVR